jgi:hypothetical protein
MTPTQQTALEALVGRAFTTEEAAAVAALVAVRDDAALHSTLTQMAPPVRQSVMVSARGLSAKIEGGPIAAEMILLALEGARDNLLASQAQEQFVFGSLLRRQLRFLDADGLDFGSPAFIAMLDQFGAMGVLTSAQVTALKAISLVPGRVSYEAMLAVLNNTTGGI